MPAHPDLSIATTSSWSSSTCRTSSRPRWTGATRSWRPWCGSSARRPTRRSADRGDPAVPGRARRDGRGGRGGADRGGARPCRSPSSTRCRSARATSRRSCEALYETRATPGRDRRDGDAHLRRPDRARADGARVPGPGGRRRVLLATAIATTTSRSTRLRAARVDGHDTRVGHVRGGGDVAGTDEFRRLLAIVKEGRLLRRRAPAGAVTRPREDPRCSPTSRSPNAPRCAHHRGRRGRSASLGSLEPYGTLQGQGDSLNAGAGRPSQRPLRRRHRDHADAARRGQDADDGRSRAGAGTHRPQRVHLHPAAVARAGVRHQGRRGGWRLLAGPADDGPQPAPHGRRARGHGRAQPVRGVHRQRTCTTATTSISIPYAVTWRRVHGHLGPGAARASSSVSAGGSAAYRARPASTSRPRASSWRSSRSPRTCGDLRARIGRIVVGTARDGRPVTTEDLQGRRRDDRAHEGRDHAEPPAEHGGRSGLRPRRARSATSRTATARSSRTASRSSWPTTSVTEAGFGADMGFEKFVQHQVPRERADARTAPCSCARSGRSRRHSGRFDVMPGHPLDPAMLVEDLDALEAGTAQPRQADRERALVRHPRGRRGQPLPDRHGRRARGDHARGARGRRRAPRSVTRCTPTAARAAWSSPTRWRTRAPRPRGCVFTYPLDEPPEAKIESIARRDVRRRGRRLLGGARSARSRGSPGWGFGGLPVCMAKTHLSLTHDPRSQGRGRRGWTLPVRDVRLSAGAGFLYALCGDIMTMPGLPSRPAGEQVDIDADGTVVGLF